MSEFGEAPLKVKDQVHLQGLAERVVLRQEGGLTALDKRRITEARQHIDIGKWSDSLHVLEGDEIHIGENLRRMVDTFGTHRRADGSRDRTTEETARHARANTALDAVIPLLETASYDQLEDSHKGALRTRIQTALTKNTRLPGFRSMSAEDQRAIVEQFLSDPKLKGEVITILKNIQGMRFTSESDILSSQKELAIQNAKGREARDKSTHARTELGRITTDLQAIRSGTYTGSGEAARINTQILANQNRMDQLDTQESTALTQLDAIANSIQPGVMMNPHQQLTSALQTQLRNITQERTRITSHQDNLHRRLESVTPEPDSLERQRAQMRGEISEANIDAAGHPIDATRKQIELAELTQQREKEEQAIAHQLEGVFSLAVGRYVAGELDASLQKLSSNEGKVKSDANAITTNELRHHIEHRWTRKIRRAHGLMRRRVEETVQNNKQVSRDFDALLHKGHDQIMRAALRTMPSIRALGDQEQIQVRINSLMGDDQFAAQFKSELVKQIVSRRALIKPFRPGELHQLMNVSSIKDSIQGALDTNETFRKQVTDMTGTGDVNMDKPDFRSRFVRAATSHPGLLLFPLTTIPWSIVSALRASREVKNSNGRRDLATQIAA